MNSHDSMYKTIPKEQIDTERLIIGLRTSESMVRDSELVLLRILLCLFLTERLLDVFNSATLSIKGSLLARSISILIIVVAVVTWGAYEVWRYAEKRHELNKALKVRYVREEYGKLFKQLQKELLTALRQGSQGNERR